MTRAPGILYVINQLSFFVSHFLHIAERAQREGYRVSVACPPGEGATSLQQAGLEFVPLQLDRKGVSLIGEIATIVSLVRAYRAVRPDLVHHFTIKPTLYGSLAARITGVPAVVNTITGLGYVQLASGRLASARRTAVRCAYRALMRHRHLRLIFENPDDRTLFVDSGIVAPSRSRLIRGAGVDTEVFRATPEATNDTPLVLLAARMLADKGVREFVGAASQLRGAGVRARFVLVGASDEGNPAAIPRATLLGWASEGVVEWWDERQDMPAVLASANLVCLPSYREGLPKVLIEAAACARAVVTTDVPGCREVVRDGENGLLVTPREVEPLARAIRLLLEDARRRAAMGARAREIAVSEFTSSLVQRETLELYRELLEEAGIPDPTR